MARDRQSVLGDAGTIVGAAVTLPVLPSSESESTEGLFKWSRTMLDTCNIWFQSIVDTFAQVSRTLYAHITNTDNPHDTSLANLIDVGLEIPVEEGQGLWYSADAGNWVNRVAFNETWPTGLADGGELNIGPGVNDIEVIAGFGVITDSHTTPLSPPVVKYLSWPQLNEAITIAPSVVGSIAWFSIVDTGVPAVPQIPVGGTPVTVGELRQFIGPTTPTEQKGEIFLGVAVHNGTEWKEVSNPNVVNQAAETLREVATTVLPLTTIISGGAVLELPSFQLEQEEGVIWENNRNWHVNKADPNREALPARSPLQFRYVNRDFTTVGALTSTVDVTQWDNAGTVELIGGSSKRTTFQRLYLDPADNFWILWGQEVFTSNSIGLANLLTSDIEVPFILQESLLLGTIVAERAASDWDPATAIFIPVRSGGSTGGGGTPISNHDDLSLRDTGDGHPDFTTALSGFVPAPVSVNGYVLSDNGTWIAQSAGVTDHGALTGLADNDHPQYGRLAVANTWTALNTFGDLTADDFSVDSLATKGVFTGSGVTRASSVIEVVTVLPGSPDANTLYFIK